MAEARLNLFDATIGVPDGNWLDSKVMRRELSQDLEKEALSHRARQATQAAESFRDDMNRRAATRDGIERKSEEMRKQQLALMQGKAEEYRNRLRNKLRPEIRD